VSPHLLFFFISPLRSAKQTMDACASMMLH
jgi:hypothetical protein